MAVFGHSGSQAPQLMHSLVIIVALRGVISRRENPKLCNDLGRIRQTNQTFDELDRAVDQRGGSTTRRRLRTYSMTAGGIDRNTTTAITLWMCSSMFGMALPSQTPRSVMPHTQRTPPTTLNMT